MSISYNIVQALLGLTGITLSRFKRRLQNLEPYIAYHVVVK